MVISKTLTSAQVRVFSIYLSKFLILLLRYKNLTTTVRTATPNFSCSRKTLSFIKYLTLLHFTYGRLLSIILIKNKYFKYKLLLCSVFFFFLKDSFFQTFKEWSSFESYFNYHKLEKETNGCKFLFSVVCHVGKVLALDKDISSVNGFKFYRYIFKNN